MEVLINMITKSDLGYAPWEVRCCQGTASALSVESSCVLKASVEFNSSVSNISSYQTTTMMMIIIISVIFMPCVLPHSLNVYILHVI